MKCIVCGNQFEAKRADARFDTDACKKKYQRNKMEYELEELYPTDDPFTGKSPFYHYRKNYRTKSGYWEDEEGKPVVYDGLSRGEPVWVNVPLNAVPVLRGGMPTMPAWMDGRQYYLWQLNGFKTDDQNRAQIIDPQPPMTGADDKIIPSRYEMGGDGSRRWGA